MAKRLELQQTPSPTSVKVTQIPGIRMEQGAINNAKEFSSLLFNLSNNVSKEADKVAAKEGELAGLKAGEDPNFKPKRDNTIRGQAFNRGALRSFQAQTSVRLTNQINEVFEKNKNDPESLNLAFAGVRVGFEKSLRQDFPEVVPQFIAQFTQLTAPLARKAGKDFLAVQTQKERSEALPAIQSQVDSLLRNIGLAGNDPNAHADIAIQRENLIDFIGDHGPQQAFEFQGREFKADAGRSGVFDINEMSKIINDLDDKAVEQAIIGPFSESRNKQGFLDQFIKLERGKKTSELRLDQVESLKSRMRTTIREERVANNERKREVVGSVRDALIVLESGKTPEGLQTLQLSVTEFPDISDILGQAIKDKDRAGEFVRSSLSEQRGQLIQLNNEAKTADDVGLINRLNRLNAETIRGLKTDPLVWAQNRGIIDPLPDVDFEEPASIQQRQQVADGLSQRYGVPVPALTSTEASTLSNVVENSEASNVLSLIDNLREGFGDEGLSLLTQQIAPKRPTLAVAFNLSGTQPVVARDIIIGQNLIKETPELKPNKSQRQLSFDAIVKDGLQSVPGNISGILDAADAVYATRQSTRSSSLLFSQENYDTALKLVLGAVETPDGEIVGGPFNHEGRTILPPIPGMESNELDDFLENMNDQDLTLFGNGKPVFSNGHAFTANMFAEGADLPQLHSIGNGRYLVSFEGIGFIESSTGGAYEIDLGSLVTQKGSPGKVIFENATGVIKR